MKINSLTKLSKLRNKYKNLKIGLCHGVFDVLHNGHINHFKDAKKKVDILVVSVTTKKFVNKGPRQPFNNDFQRLNILESIKYRASNLGRLSSCKYAEGFTTEKIISVTSLNHLI